MTRAEARRWQKEIAHWANGGNLWAYSKQEGIGWVQRNNNNAIYFNSQKATAYIIEDEFFEYRKAIALGKTVEVGGYSCKPYFRTWNSHGLCFTKGTTYRVKPDSKPLTVKDVYDDLCSERYISLQYKNCDENYRRRTSTIYAVKNAWRIFNDQI